LKHLIIGTAGHVDHGKTRLISALTGINTDRLKEEMARGISIELGFATLDLGDVRAGIVDVPGHEKFVRTMVAGAGGMDIAMLVVAADEGVMPQTREHVEVLDLLGVKRAVIAMNKLDLVERELAELAAEEISEYLEDTSLAGAPVILVSAATGEGVDELRAALGKIAAETPERDSQGSYRMPIDRVFTIKGMGTVVTGTSWSGHLRVGDKLELLPRGLPVRVRELQVHDQSVQEASAGQRTAVALHGVKHDELVRGEVLATPGRFQSSHMMTLRVQALAANTKALKQRTRIRFHFGTQEVLGRLVLLDREELQPGEECLAQARLEEPAVATPGDRVILRFYSPMRTVAGATIIEADAPKRRFGRKKDLEAVRLREAGDPAEILERAVIEKGLAGLPEKEASSIADKHGDESVLGALVTEKKLLRLGKSLFHMDNVQSLADEIARVAAEYHESRPLAWGPGRENLRSTLARELPQASFQKMLEHLEATGRLRLRGEGVRAAQEDPTPPASMSGLVDKVETAWRVAGLKSTGLVAELEVENTADLIDYLVGIGTLIRIDGDFLVHEKALDTLRAGLRELFAASEVLAVGEIGKHFDISRKISVPLLEHCDREGWTVRKESERRAGEGL
jgi:selenocysteine-specific elongation factor